MRQLALLLFLLGVPTVSYLAVLNAQESPATNSDKKSSSVDKLEIVPLITLKPGETKELLFSTWCTVGVTRGGGFSLAEMIDGKPSFKNSKLKGNREFNKQGVTISVPDFTEGTKFANAAEFAPLKKFDLDAFRVTVTASVEAQPGVLEMHLVDATCAGHCKTDFRVLVVEPK